MVVLARIVVGVLLIAHGLVHLLYIAEDVQEFSFAGSWLMPEPAKRPVGFALMSATVVAFALLGLAVWGVPWLAYMWPALTIAAATASLVLLVVYWDTRLVFGLALDIALIAVALTRPEWTQMLDG